MLALFGIILLAFAVVDTVVSHPRQEQSSDTGFGYELLDIRLEHLDLKLYNTSVEQTSVLTKQSKLLEQIVNILSAVQVQTSQLLDNQVNHHKRFIESCEEATTSGWYRLSYHYLNLKSVVCDVEVFDGGWLVVQQRLDGSVNFNRSWIEYRDGFGIVGPNSEFWLGLETIHQLTKGGDHELLVQLKNETGHYGYARYRHFQIAGENQGYQLSLGDYNGTLGERMQYNKNQKFSSYDRQNDFSGNFNCAKYNGSGWWYGFCSYVHLNGPYKKDNNTGHGIYWYEWTDAATYSRMLIRRRFR